jgi:hypothetical protein
VLTTPKQCFRRKKTACAEANPQDGSPHTRQLTFLLLAIGLPEKLHSPGRRGGKHRVCKSRQEDDTSLMLPKATPVLLARQYPASRTAQAEKICSGKVSFTRNMKWRLSGTVDAENSEDKAWDMIFSRTLPSTIAATSKAGRGLSHLASNHDHYPDRVCKSSQERDADTSVTRKTEIP